MLKRFRIIIHILIAHIMMLLTTTVTALDVTTSHEEAILYELVNEYRAENGLPAIPFSKSLTHVAQTHVKDLQSNPPTGDCNLHSWSDKGAWTSCCYTPDHAEAQCMWDKPSELTNYTGNGYENAYWHSFQATAVSALEGWKSSPPHNAAILNQDIWATTTWNALGIGIYGRYAVLWFGKSTDPEPSPAPVPLTGEISVEYSVDTGTTWIELQDGGSTVDFGTTDLNVPIPVDFKIKNVDWVSGHNFDVGTISLPTGFSFTTTVPATQTIYTDLAHGPNSFEFTVAFDASSEGITTGSLSIENTEGDTGGDGDERPFNFSVKGTVPTTSTPMLPEITVTEASTNIVDGGTTIFSSTVGTPVSKTFTITNSGDNDLDLGAIAVSGADATLFSLTPSTLPNTLAPNATTNFTITFSPTAVGDFAGTIQINNSDADEAPFDIALAASATDTTTVPDEGEIEVSEASLGRFASGTTVNYTATTSATVGTTITKTFTVTNTGNASLNVSNISASGSGFTLSGTPKLLDPNATLSFDVTFSATAIGTFQGTVSIANDDTDENPFTFNVSATVVEQTTKPPVVETPEIAVFVVDATLQEVTDNQTTAIALNTSTGQPVTTQFRIKNTGNSALSLVSPTSLPNGFRLVGDFPSTISINGTADFTLQLDATTEGHYGGNFSFANNDTDENPFNFPISGQVTTSTVSVPEIVVLEGSTEVSKGTTLSFGKTPVGQAIVKTLTVKNIGSATLNLSSPITFSAGGTGFTINSFNPTSLSESQSQTFTVTLGATTAGVYAGTLSFDTNDSNENPYTFQITGTVEADISTVDSQEIAVWRGDQSALATGTATLITDGTDVVVEFGTTNIGTPITQAFTVQNLGSANLQLNDLQHPSCYTLAEGTLPTVVPAGKQISFTMQLTATALGVCEGRVTLSNDDADESAYDFPVHGTVIEEIQGQVNLTVNVVGEGEIIRNPVGSDCGTMHCASHATGSTVTLTAVPNTGAQFVGWSDDCAGTEATISVTMDTTKHCTATFSKATVTDQHVNLTVNVNGNGLVTANLTGTNCGANCTTYDLGASVTLTATASSGITFTGWSGNCVGTAPTTMVVMDTAKDCTATFVASTTPPPSSQTQQTLTIAVSGIGTVTSDTGAINCGTVCSADYITGSIVQLTASPASTFTGWEGDCNSIGMTTAIALDTTKHCTAVFSSQTDSTQDGEIGNCFNQRGLFADNACLNADSLQAGAVNARGEPMSTIANIRGGISVGNGPYQRERTVTMTDQVITRGVIKVEPADIGKSADIIVVGIHYADIYPDGSKWYMLDGCNQCVKPWPDMKLSELAPLTRQNTLPTHLIIDMYMGNFPVLGRVEILAGYREIETGKIIYSADAVKVDIKP